MRPIPGKCLTRSLSLVLTMGCLNASIALAAEFPSAGQSRGTPTVATPFPNTAAKIVTPISAIVTPASALAEDVIFDQQLPTSPSPLPNVCVPNCTSISIPGAAPLDSGTPISPQPPAPSQAVADPNSPFSNPNSVFSTSQQPSQMPTPMTPLAAGQGASTAMSQVPAFMGDFFSGAPTTITGTIRGNSYLPLSGSVSVPGSGGVGIMKLAENTSPLPRDRIFLSYNYFSNVNLIPGGVAVNRFTPGIEKTFFEGNSSVEVRVPMALTLGATTPLDQSGIPSYNTDQYQLGNLTTYFKTLLYRDKVFALSTGLGVAAPTADNARVQDSLGNPVAVIKNQAWHVMPFLGSVYTPNDRWYAQTMFQVDFATNGNAVSTQNFGGGLQKDGSLNDPTYLFGSIGTGYWIYQSYDPWARLTKVSLISEFHLNTTLQHTDVVQGVQSTTGTYQSQIQTQNMVVGTNILFDQNKSLLLGYVAPIGGGADKAFSGEFRVLFNWYFGGTQNRATQVQF